MSEKLQLEIVLHKQALEAIVLDYLRRKSPQSDVTVRLSGFYVNRKRLPDEVEKNVRLSLVIDTTPKAQQQTEYGYEEINISPVPEPEPEPEPQQTPKRNGRKAVNDE